jgi:hypothetical protein
LNGFTQGFKINYEGQRVTCEYRNLLSVIQNPIEAQTKLNNEISLGRMAGPFCHACGFIPNKRQEYPLQA